jgi:hypothetical protein
MAVEDSPRWPRVALPFPQFGTNFADNRRSLGRYSSLADWGHGVKFYSFSIKIKVPTCSLRELQCVRYIWTKLEATIHSTKCIFFCSREHGIITRWSQQLLMWIYAKRNQVPLGVDHVYIFIYLQLPAYYTKFILFPLMPSVLYNIHFCIFKIICPCIHNVLRKFLSKIRNLRKIKYCFITILQNIP